MEHITNLIVGCGLSGIILANKLANELKQKVLIIDKKNHIGGTCYDYYDDNGICIHRYGPHIFRTDSAEIWHYLSQYTSWYPYMHKVLGIIDGIEIPIPFNLNSLYKVFPPALAGKLEAKLISQFGYGKKIPILELRRSTDTDLKNLADFVYHKVFLGYTLKQWDMAPEGLDPSVTASVPVIINRDDRYFQEKYQGIPAEGYTGMFQKMLNNPLIEIRLSTSFQDIKDHISYERLFYSGPIEEFFDNCYGPLPYRSLRFEFHTYNQQYFQKAAVVNYPENYDFTRISEYKHFLPISTGQTVICCEYPEPFTPDCNERIYPILNDANTKIYQRYLRAASKFPEIYFFGRLGAYKYYDMNHTIQGALNLFNQIKGK